MLSQQEKTVLIFAVFMLGLMFGATFFAANDGELPWYTQRIISIIFKKGEAE